MNKNKSSSGEICLHLTRPAALLACAVALAACQSFPGPRTAAHEAAPPAPSAPAPGETLEGIMVPSFAKLEPIPEDTDLLDRLRSGFALPESDNAAVQREVTWFADHPQYLDRVFERASLYLYHITDELETRGMPADLALLPVVESAFDPFAYSRGRAAGLWQIIPGTGKRLGVEQNWWFDGRRDVLESTRAALDYLEALHEEFNGDWLLAIAGYNSGEGNVERAVRRATADGRDVDFWDLKRYLPEETRTYVPRLLAIREIVANPEKYGVTLPDVDNEPTFAVVDTGSQIDMALAAELAGVDTDELYALNAGVNRWATDPEGPYRLLVPAAQAEQFESGLAALGDRDRVEWTRHRVKPGETIGGIADQYHTTVGVLREVNELRGNVIRAGEELMIPHALQSLASYTQSADVRAARVQNVPRSGVRNEHVVRSGETLWSIARAYGVDARKLASWNAMAPADVLSVGRTLVVWSRNPGAEDGPAVVPAVAVSASGVRAVPATSLTPHEPIRQVTYVVRRGDSLSSIARRFRVTVPQLLEWNRVSAQRYLQPGQRLMMYVNVTEQSG